jgi:Na+-driven multidrug efflux pump
MSKEQIKGLSIISSILMIMGLILMFFSVSIGTYLGDSWVSSQPDGYDDSRYMVVIENYINNLVIIGSILFGVGLLTAVFTYIKSFTLWNKENKNVSDNDD